MKKVLAYITFILAVLGCTRIETTPNTDVLVDFCVSSSELIMADNGTKAQFPLDPSVENTIDNLWVLQYADDGRLVRSVYSKLPTPVLNTTLQVKLARSQNSTVIIVANMGGFNTGDSEWPSGEDFKWGEHGGGSLYNLQNKLFSYSLDNPGMPHMFMTGITQMAVDDESASHTINMMLSRLASKFKVTIKSSSADTYSNVRLQMVNCPVRFSLFPNDNLSAEYTQDLASYSLQEVCGPGEFLSSTAFKSFYFYSNENLSPDPSCQTMIRVLAAKGGQEVSTMLPVSSLGTTFRNTYYNIQITLR